eukprot:2704381-Pyramimonas_sp.AAC.1
MSRPTSESPGRAAKEGQSWCSFTTESCGAIRRMQPERRPTCLTAGPPGGGAACVPIGAMFRAGRLSSP